MHVHACHQGLAFASWLKQLKAGTDSWPLLLLLIHDVTLSMAALAGDVVVQRTS